MQLSRFNILTDLPGKPTVYNTLTGALAILEGSSGARIKQAIERNDVSLIPKTLLKSCLDDGYVVTSQEDEMAILRTRNLTGRTQNELLISIMPTFKCNFDCGYCFEKNCIEVVKRPSMGQRVEESVIRYIAKQAPKKSSISVDWYGGEPLMRFPQLRRMNDAIAKICHDCGTDYTVSVTTNGYLLSRQVVEYLRNFQVSHLQITLDGPPETHDSSRPLLTGGPTFERIVTNISRAVDAGIPVVVRVNVWRPNVNEVGRLYDILGSRGLKNRVTILLKAVLSSPLNPCDEECFSPEEAGQNIMAIYKEAALKGWVVVPYVDTLQGHQFCIVDSVGQIIVGPDGTLYKCGEQFTPQEQVGHLTTDGELGLDGPRWSRWVSKDPFIFPECQNCNILPICMGGCSMKRFWRQQESPCIDLKFCMEQLIEVLVLNEDNVSRRKGTEQ